MSYARCLITALLLVAVSAGACAAGPPAYRITKTVPLGSPDGWDYLYFEPQSQRVFVAHSNEITVVDGRTGNLVGRIEHVGGVNGVTVIPELGKGYTDSRAGKAAVAFDLASLKARRRIPAGEDTDAIVYDPSTRRVFVMDGDGMKAFVIDPGTDQTVATIDLQGKPEFAVSDETGHVFINITDRQEIVRVDARSATIQARWPISSCQSPHGLAMDRATHRLFATCLNNRLVVVDADNGRLVATLPIGKGSDGAAFDSKRKLIFSSNGEGTLSIISEQGPDQFVSLGEVPTKPFARTMTLDPATGRLYLVTADLDEVNPTAQSLRQRYAIRRGTVQLLFVDPS